MLLRRDGLASAAVQLANAARGRIAAPLRAVRDAARAYQEACGDYDRAFARATASTWRSAPLRLPCNSGAWPTRGVRGVRGVCVTPFAARRAKRVLDERGGHHLHRCHLKKGWHWKNDGRA